jgi:hypothetical protein
MPEIVHPRMATTWRWSNICLPQQSIKRTLDRVIRERLATIADKHVVVA